MLSTYNHVYSIDGALSPGTITTTIWPCNCGPTVARFSQSQLKHWSLIFVRFLLSAYSSLYTAMIHTHTRKYEHTEIVDSHTLVWTAYCIIIIYYDHKEFNYNPMKLSVYNYTIYYRMVLYNLFGFCVLLGAVWSLSVGRKYDIIMTIKHCELNYICGNNGATHVWKIHY
jgi:hypothetical protein